MQRFESIGRHASDGDYVSVAVRPGRQPASTKACCRLRSSTMSASSGPRCERIFTRTWVFVAHDTEIGEQRRFRVAQDRPRQGDRDPRRHGIVRVLYNHCRHRGTEICYEDRGNTKTFKCPYHGWIYKNNGDWLGAPQMQDAYGEPLDAREWGLLRAPKVDSIHGFIFASLSDDVRALQRVARRRRMDDRCIDGAAPRRHDGARPARDVHVQSRLEERRRELRRRRLSRRHDALVGDDGRVHSGPQPCVVVRPRLSCSRMATASSVTRCPN